LKYNVCASLLVIESVEYLPTAAQELKDADCVKSATQFACLLKTAHAAFAVESVGFVSAIRYLKYPVADEAIVSGAEKVSCAPSARAVPSATTVQLTLSGENSTSTKPP